MNIPHPNIPRQNTPDLEEPVLPALRQDLALECVNATPSGQPKWLIHDRIANRFLRISQQVANILSCWAPVAISTFLARANAHLNQTVTAEQVSQIAEFLYANGLTQQPPGGHYVSQFESAARHKKGWFLKAIHSYLFFKIPLFNPQPLLDRHWVWVRLLLNKRIGIFLVLLGILGLYFTSRQWQQFSTTFTQMLSFEGLLWFGLAVVISKSLHELGHAFTARKYGVEVPTIGLAFVVMVPILYTDTTAAWRLEHNLKRLHIDLAGIVTELALAVIATLFWVFLPDGMLRTLAFTTATTAWILSLAVNLNPFMRFDGYYILSDLLDCENLQARSFDYAKWKLRELLFGLGDPPPEQMTPIQGYMMVAYGWMVWVYRLFLFLGIVLLVYHMFFKLAGIALFAIEIVGFILMPIVREMRQWWRRAATIFNSTRTWYTMGILLLVIALLILPLSRRTRVPAILTQQTDIALIASTSGQLVGYRLQAGKMVKSGQLLAQIKAPSLDHEISQTKLRLKTVNRRRSRVHSDSEDLNLKLILDRQQLMLVNQIKALEKKQAELQIRAPVDGVIVDANPNMHQGRWVSEGAYFARMRSKDRPIMKALADEAAMERIKTGAAGRFIADDPRMPALEVTLTNKADIASYGNELPYLAHIQNGFVPVNKTPDSRWEPVAGRYALELRPAHHPPNLGGNLNQNPLLNTESVVRGVIFLDATPQSALAPMVSRIISVAIRESGF